uniref:Putative GPI anchored cell wall protein n=1 Tax=Phakopsora pachyrhizi TaxID=170000 RepID=A0A0S1MIW8_PHAPC
MTSVISAKPSVTSAAGSTVVPSGTPAASGCPADINGAYQYPHLIVPVDAANPNKAYGTQYNGTINSKVSTIFNFDIPASYAGKTCSTVFLFPQLDQLETSSYSFNDKGGFTIAVLNGVATESTTYANAPAVAKQIGSVDALKRGSSYTLSEDACPAGTRVSFEVTSTGGLDLSFFEDYNPSPLGLYVRAC